MKLLFEFLDADRDGKLSVADLVSLLDRLCALLFGLDFKLLGAPGARF